MPTAPEQVQETMANNNKLTLLQLRVPQQEAAPQAANQWATLLEWEVYSPTSVNFLQIGITASHKGSGLVNNEGQIVGKSCAC